MNLTLSLVLVCKVPTPIQRRAIPTILRGIDCVVMARTGSGKTAAFLVPMLQLLGSHSSKVGVRGMLLSPTRELAVQTFKFAKQIGSATGLRHCLLVGGDSMEEQFQNLASNPDTIIGTPGRVMHHMDEVNRNPAFPGTSEPSHAAHRPVLSRGILG